MYFSCLYLCVSVFVYMGTSKLRFVAYRGTFCKSQHDKENIVKYLI